MNEDKYVVEGLYGVYLLYCTNPEYEGRTYIGYTVDPNRRIKQHNRGTHSGGARRTNNRGPWEMVLLVYGFPNDISALGFEWAWQHPDRSRRLRHVTKKKHHEKMYDFHLRVLSEMLRVGPWNRLALTIRWLKQEFAREFPSDLSPPRHMPIAYGPVISKKIGQSQGTTSQTSVQDDDKCLCYFCYEVVCQSEKITCISPGCLLAAHVICLAKVFRKGSFIIAVEGRCPECDAHILWGDLVRKMRGCYSNLTSSGTDSRAHCD
ncbi:structure-specific endonuclease subunit slx1 [Zootermopsis nevadensis]|nr:structure-specific endonuclease subunit slx1 [Zootermopsis nevadensis]